MWKDFTGEDYPDTLSYEVMSDLERRSRIRIETMRLENGQTVFGKVWRWYRLRKQRATTKDV